MKQAPRKWASPGRSASAAPPSIDPSYTMRGARSVVSLVLPMNVPAIYTFLGKTSSGLHAISRDKKRSNWGRHVVKEWLDSEPDPRQTKYVRSALMRQGAMSGDSTPRFEVIRRIGAKLWPREYLEAFLPDCANLPEDEKDIADLLTQSQERLGVFGLADPYVLTCGQCAFVCGPDFDETKKRYDLLTRSGFMVPVPSGRMMRVETLDEYFRTKKKYPAGVDRAQMTKEAAASGSVWFTNYFGPELKGEIQNAVYQARNRRACARTGLAGKEAKPLYIGNPGYLLSVIRRGKHKKP